MDCIVEFSSFELLIMSFDVFYHNHRYQDDCAQPLEEIFQVPTAKVSRKTYTNKFFTEISLFIGRYELLVVAGYIHSHRVIKPFLLFLNGKIRVAWKIRGHKSVYQPFSFRKYSSSK